MGVRDMLMEQLRLLRNLLVGDHAKRVVLAGGLLVEYAPATAHDPLHRLRIARQKHLPGDHELVSVRLRVLAAANSVGQPVDRDSLDHIQYAERWGNATAWHGYEIRWRTAAPGWVQGALL